MGSLLPFPSVSPPTTVLSNSRAILRSPERPDRAKAWTIEWGGEGGRKQLEQVCSVHFRSPVRSSSARARIVLSESSSERSSGRLTGVFRVEGAKLGRSKQRQRANHQPSLVLGSFPPLRFPFRCSCSFRSHNGFPPCPYSLVGHCCVWGSAIATPHPFLLYTPCSSCSQHCTPLPPDLAWCRRQADWFL